MTQIVSLRGCARAEGGEHMEPDKFSRIISIIAIILSIGGIAINLLLLSRLLTG